MRVATLLALLPVLATACKDDTNTDDTTIVDDTSADDTSTDDTSTDDTAVEEGRSNGTFTLYDGFTTLAIANATMTIGDTSVTTDANGQATFTLDEGSEFSFSTTVDGYLVREGYGTVSVDDFGYRVAALQSALLSAALGGVGITVDPAKTQVWVSVAGGDAQPLVGASVAITATNQLAVALVEGGAGFAPGSTLPEGARGPIMFVNTDPGSFDVTVTPPNGETCVVYPGGTVTNTFTVSANTHWSVQYVCQ